MRFDTKKQNEVVIVRKWFAFFPITINGETRWLEFVKVRGYYWLNSFTNNWRWESQLFVD